MHQYIHDNANDEHSHANFINAYLAAHGADPINLDKFRTLPSSKATGARQVGRSTNLMQLTLDTSYWTRYRSDSQNPDLGDTLPQAVPDLAVGQHAAIPRSDDDLRSWEHVQAIANTAAFHFGMIEQGGGSLYASLAQRVSDVEVLRILLSIGPTEVMHFQTWQEKAGQAPPLTDPTTGVVFPDLSSRRTWSCPSRRSSSIASSRSSRSSVPRRPRGRACGGRVAGRQRLAHRAVTRVLRRRDGARAGRGRGPARVLRQRLPPKGDARIPPCPG